MKKGESVAKNILTGHFPDVDDVIRIVYQVTLGEDGTFGMTGGPGGIDHQTGIFRQDFPVRWGRIAGTEKFQFLVGFLSRYFQKRNLLIDPSYQACLFRLRYDHPGPGIIHQIFQFLSLKIGIQGNGNDAPFLESEVGHHRDDRFVEEENYSVPLFQMITGQEASKSMDLSGKFGIGKYRFHPTVSIKGQCLIHSMADRYRFKPISN